MWIVRDFLQNFILQHKKSFKGLVLREKAVLLRGFLNNKALMVPENAAEPTNERSKPNIISFYG